MDKVSILVLSCDKNLDVAKLFFEYFSENWKDCKYPVYLGVEKELPQIDNVNVLQSNEINWAARVRCYLKEIPTPYVLLFLEDFIVEEAVQSDRVAYYADVLEADKKIANITFENIPAKDNEKAQFEHLLLRNSKANYLVNMQVGLWNKEILLALMKDKENPWQTEIYGSIRARKYKDYKFYCMDSDENMPIKNGRGWLVVRGKWNLTEIERLGIDVKKCSNKREFERYSREQVLVPRHKRIPEIIGSRYRKRLSHFHIYL